MTGFATVDELAGALVRAGVPSDLARRQAKVELGVRTADDSKSVAEQLGMPPIPWPVKLLLPWSHLVSDNAKYQPVIQTRNGEPVAVNILKPQYREAKRKTRDVAIAHLGGLHKYEPANYPLELIADIWVPDTIRAHDQVNFAKCLQDALEGVLFTKDHWIHKATYERRGVDVDAPRAEITMRPIAQ